VGWTGAVDVALISGLFVRMIGPRTGKSLILLHAFADSGVAFLPLFDTPLADRFRLVTIDLAGFGASPRQEHVRGIAGHAEAFAGLARSLMRS
jgi:pimeloyl-ACP methyl ester carboxylesterase